MSRAQKLIVGVMALILVTVLVALGTLLRPNPAVSPLSTAALPAVRTAAPVTATPGAVTPARTSATPADTAVIPDVQAARRIEELAKDVSRIRELPRQQEIALNFLGDAEMAAYLRRLRTNSERQDSTQAEQALFAALDLLPQPGEAFPPAVQARAKNVIAFYDQVENQVFIGPAGRETNPPDISIVHQYAHACIDQNFDLVALAEGAPNLDARRARDALIEGDATAVLALQRFGKIDPADIEELASHMVEAEVTDYEAYVTSRAMRGVLVFPYLEGTAFVAALLQAGWWPAVNSAYLDPPDSTEQILHPEKYLTSQRDTPQIVLLPDLREELGTDWRVVAQAVLGELVVRAHLDQYLPDTQEATAAAAGWDGDLAAVWQDTDDRKIFVMRTLWDSEAEAAEFARIYGSVIENRLKAATMVVRPILPAGGHWWRGEAGSAYLQRSQDAVLIIWSPDTETMEKVLAAFVFGEE